MQGAHLNAVRLCAKSMSHYPLIHQSGVCESMPSSAERCACVCEAPASHTELLLSSVHTCTIIAVMLAQTGTDTVNTHTHTRVLLRSPAFPVSPPLLQEPLLTLGLS